MNSNVQLNMLFIPIISNSNKHVRCKRGMVRPEMLFAKILNLAVLCQLTYSYTLSWIQVKRTAYFMVSVLIHG